MAKKELTPKRKAFAKEYVKSKGNGVQSALKTYNTKDYDTANQIAVENLQKPTVKREIERLMDKNGMKDIDLIKVHTEGLNATKDIYKNNNATGEIDKVASTPDHAIRHKYLDTAYKLKGMLDNKDAGNQQLNVAFIINTK